MLMKIPLSQVHVLPNTKLPILLNVIVLTSTWFMGHFHLHAVTSTQWRSVKHDVNFLQYFSLFRFNIVFLMYMLKNFSYFHFLLVIQKRDS
jgi:hypothetical protein